ncbi:MAG TPA: GtrA family protein [Acidimicrobiales bacterium]|nr:GtrA family protein [Acidimicrobiales bacterium]
MVDALVRLWRLYHTPTGKKLVRYAMVSVISTVVSFSILGLVYGVLRLWTEVPSTVFANLVASVPAYYLNRSWSWGKNGRSHILKEVVPFWTMSAAGLALSIFTASQAQHLSDVHHLHHFGRTVLVEGANTGAFAILWVVKFLVFNRLFKVHPVIELEAQAEAELFVEAAVEVEGAEP